MNTTLFIPKKCKVGFNKREDCFSKKLGYVIAQDGKKWRKENSWNGWIEKPGDPLKGRSYVNGEWVENKGKHGDDMQPFEFSNVPTEGFVLNKKVGGYKSGWDMRQTYSRIFDPRGFEFEISVQNLLYILEHCNSVRGKALEGEFVYSWDGKDLVLLPAHSPDYQSSLDFKKITDKKIGVKDLVEGCVYFNKDKEEYVYLGKRDWYCFNNDSQRLAQKLHIFYKPPQTVKWNNGYEYTTSESFIDKSSLSFLKGKVSDTVVENYAEIFEKFQKDCRSADAVSFELVPAPLAPDYNKNTTLFRFIDNDKIFIESVVSGYRHYYNEKDQSIYISDSRRFFIQEKRYEYISSHDKTISRDSFSQYKFCNLFVTYSNGVRKEVSRLYEI